MFTAYLDGVWYYYDQRIPLPHVLQQGETVYWSNTNGDWQKLPVVSLNALQGYEVIIPTKMTLQQVYTHLFLTAKQYTGIWSAATDLNTWLADSQQFAVGKALTAKRNAEIVLDVPEALFDPILCRYLRERIETFAYFLKLVREGTYQ